MANSKQDQWIPPLWCRACGRAYRRYLGGLRDCCAKCSSDINRIESALQRELRVLEAREKEGDT